MSRRRNISVPVVVPGLGIVPGLRSNPSSSREENIDVDLKPCDESPGLFGAHSLSSPEFTPAQRKLRAYKDRKIAEIKAWTEVRQGLLSKLIQRESLPSSHCHFPGCQAAVLCRCLDCGPMVFFL